MLPPLLLAFSVTCVNGSGLSAHCLHLFAFAWWRLSLSVSVCLASFPSLDTLGRYAHGVTRFTSARLL